MGDAARSGRVDLHLHCFASNVTDYFAANRLAIPESWSDPFALHRDLMAQGMTLFTLTDHNSIDGIRRVRDAGHAGVFLSSELTATFPEDGCNVHITVANVTEAQFREADALRRNVYELIAWCEEQVAREAERGGNRIAWWMTHPLMSTQNRPYGREGALALPHLEKALLLCPALEVRNGTRTKVLNELTHEWVTRLDAAMLERLADRHGIAPRGETPWRKATLAGSDDHAGINHGRTWTEFPLPEGRAATPNDLIDAIRARAVRPAGAHGGPIALAHAMLKLLHDGRDGSPAVARARAAGAAPRTAGQAESGTSFGGSIGTLLAWVFEPGAIGGLERLKLGWRRRVLARRVARAERSGVDRAPFEELLEGEAHALFADPAFAAELSKATRTDDRIWKVVSTLVNRVLARYARRLARVERGDLVRAVHELVAMVASHVMVSLPYLVSYVHQSSDRCIARDVRRAFELRAHQRAVLVTDTFFDVNGVARTIQRMLAESHARGIDFTVMSCLSAADEERCRSDRQAREWLDSGRLKLFRPVLETALPGYQGLALRMPPFLEMVRWLQEEGFTRMQISTPGAVGVAGLAAAKLLQIETSSTYHTCFPEYVENYTNDISLEALAWRCMILFYHAVDEVVVPSKFVARLLHERGLRKKKLLVLDRWVDPERFHPRFRTPGFWRERGVADEESVVKFLYVGRLGVEKNLDLLADAFRAFCRADRAVHLLFVGDGPHRAALERKLAGLPVTFVGFLQGETLARAIASADVKVFPSTTDTWGNAPLEAQASGLPVIVTDRGGPQELMVDGETGLRVPGRDPHALLQAMTLLLDPERRARMGRAARAYVEANVVERPFSAILDPEAHRRRTKALRKELARLAELPPLAPEDGDDLEEELVAPTGVRA
ncbi:MAG: glycosyltransferase [Planctomycetes bacterium]|nr:glycosyltransferase [Planctomycetota bacterium]